MINVFKWKNNITRYPMRIINIDGTPEAKNVTIFYQISGKSTVSTDTPENLILELGGLEGFSAHDSKLIYELFITQTNAPKYRIKAMHFSLEHECFEIEDVVNQRIMQLSAQEALLLETAGNNFSRQNIVALQYAALKAKNQREQKAIQYLKRKAQIHVIKHP